MKNENYKEPFHLLNNWNSGKVYPQKGLAILQHDVYEDNDDGDDDDGGDGDGNNDDGDDDDGENDNGDDGDDNDDGNDNDEDDGDDDGDDYDDDVEDDDGDDLITKEKPGKELLHSSNVRLRTIPRANLVHM